MKTLKPYAKSIYEWSIKAGINLRWKIWYFPERRVLSRSSEIKILLSVQNREAKTIFSGSEVISTKWILGGEISLKNRSPWLLIDIYVFSHESISGRNTNSCHKVRVSFGSICKRWSVCHIIVIFHVLPIFSVALRKKKYFQKVSPVTFLKFVNFYTNTSLKMEKNKSTLS